eukprot:g10281.t1
MKIDRQKKASKDVRRYKMTFGFHEPYRVLFDPTFIHVALESRIQIKEQLCKILGTHKVTPMVTTCAVNELKHMVERLGGQYKGALKIAEGFYQIKCGCCESGEGRGAENKQAGKTARDCIRDTFQSCPKNADGANLQSVGAQIVVAQKSNAKAANASSSSSSASASAGCKKGCKRDEASEEDEDEDEEGQESDDDSDGPEARARNKTSSDGNELRRGERNYRCWFVATQDESLKKQLRLIPGVPIFTLNGQVPRLEPFSKASNNYLSDRNTTRVVEGLSEWEVKKLPVLQSEIRQKELELEARAGKKKRMRGHRANPLACMKKKKKVLGTNGAFGNLMKVKKNGEDGGAGAEKKKQTRSRNRNKNKGVRASGGEGTGSAAGMAAV